MKKRTALSILLAIVMLISAVSFSAATQRAGAANKLMLTDNDTFSIETYTGYIYGATVGSPALQLTSSFSGQNTKVFSATGTEMAASARLMTGAQIRLFSASGTVLDTLTVIIGGDIDENGQIDNNDLVLLKASLKTSFITLKAEAFAAADTDKSGKLSTSDYIRLKRHLRGTYYIELQAPYENIAMPSLIGLTSEEATQLLTSNRLEYTINEEYSTDYMIGRVMRQSVAAGTTIRQGSKITITVSKGRDPNQPKTYTPVNYSGSMKAVWLSQFDMASTFQSNSETTFRNNINAAFKTAKEKGFNTVFVQVRPNGDSFFPSEYYPYSKYVLNGSYSATATKSYDALKALLDEGHKYGLSIHAWINPFRLMSASEITNVNNKYAIKQWYNSSYYNGRYIVNVDGNYYLNPAYQAPGQLIVDGIAEICNNYDVDGIHFDDYFYPTTAASFDSEAYNNQSTYTVLGDFRRNNVSRVIKDVYDTVKSIDRRIIFGVSPAGDPTYVQLSQYADVNLWCSTNGYIDYIMPQLYYGFNNSANPFVSTATKWSNKVTASQVRLYAGLALYKACDPNKRTSSDGTEWNNSNDILKREIKYLATTLTKYDGVSVYCYAYLSYTNGATETANMLSAMNTYY